MCMSSVTIFLVANHLLPGPMRNAIFQTSSLLSFPDCYMVPLYLSFPFFVVYITFIITIIKCNINLFKFGRKTRANKYFQQCTIKVSESVWFICETCNMSRKGYNGGWWLTFLLVQDFLLFCCCEYCLCCCCCLLLFAVVVCCCLLLLRIYIVAILK